MTNTPLPRKEDRPLNIEAQLDDLPEDLRRQLGSPSGSRRVNITQQVQQFSHSGPLPHSTELHAYGKIIPNMPERLLCMEEQRLNANIKNIETELKLKQFALEKDAYLTEMHLRNTTCNERRGQWMALLVALSIIFLIGFAIYSHAAWEITACLTAVFGGSIATIFFTNRNPLKENPKETTKTPEEKE